MDVIIDSLVEAGYYRARISTLSDFDKIIGGMAWAMKVFSDINIDVFYADSLDLGQKIALTERLVMVLLVIKCPYQLEPHQIVGLDFTNLLPVIRWLIKRSEEVRREHEAFNRLLALRHYHRVTCTSVTLDRSGWSHVASISDLRRHLKGKRQQHVDAIDESTGARSGGPLGGQSEASKDCEEAENATAHLLERINTDFKDNQQVSFVQLATILRADQLDPDRTTAASPLKGKQVGRPKVPRRPLMIPTSVAPATSSDEGESSDNNDETSRVTTDCLPSCGPVDIQQPMSATTESRAVVAPAAGHEDGGDGEVIVSEQERRLHRELDNELLATNQKILNLLKKLDSMPSQLEIGQYQRRYIELHQQLISKNKDVKKLYDLYNTLDVTKHYLIKEINLLDSVSENIDLTTNSVSNRQLFLTQFNDIIGKIKQIREDMQMRLDKLRQKSDLLNAEYANLLEDNLLD